MLLDDLVALAGETVEETLDKLHAAKLEDLSKWSASEIDILTDAAAPQQARRARLCAALALLIAQEKQEFWLGDGVCYLRLLLFALEHSEHLERPARAILLHDVRHFLKDRLAGRALEALQLHPEDVVNTILLDRGRVRPAFRGLSYTQRFVDDWYLRDRMDQALHQAIVTNLPEPGRARASEESEVRRIRQAVERRWGAWLAIILALLVGGNLAAERWEVIRPWLALMLYALILYGLGWGVCRLCARRVNPLRRLMPRLTVSLAVGYAALALTEEAWAFPLTATPAACLLVSLAALLASALYLFRHVADQLGDRVLAWRRSLFLLLQTLTTSLMIGILVTAFFGYTSVPEKVLTLAKESRWLGLRRVILLPAPFAATSDWHLVLLPGVVFFFACMALFIGVFLQLLWEKEPVTEPLA